MMYVQRSNCNVINYNHVFADKLGHLMNRLWGYYMQDKLYRKTIYINKLYKDRNLLAENGK